jgi:putative Holliday junction resolvase
LKKFSNIEDAGRGMRILALDVGEKRVGAAVSDPLGCSAQPLTTLSRRPHSEFIKALGPLAGQVQAELVLPGPPRRTDGRRGPEAQRVLALAGEIKAKLGLECATWDEWFTTQAAERLLREGGLKREARRQVVDQTAAALILDSYLNHLARSGLQARAPGAGDPPG